MRKTFLIVVLAIAPAIVVACNAEQSSYTRYAQPDYADAATTGGLLIGCDTYDPAKVYAFGILTPSRGGENTATADLETGNWCGIVNDSLESGGGPAKHARPALRPDGRLLYARRGQDHHVYVFARDANLLYGGSLYGWSFKDGEAAVDNDAPVATACAGVISGVLIWPDSGEAAVRCNGELIAKDGRRIAPNGLVHSLGFTSHALATVLIDASAPSRLAIFDGTGTPTPFPTAPNVGRVFGVRARADGFLVAVAHPATGAAELWQYGFDGMASRIGVYAAIPWAQRIDSSSELPDALSRDSAIDAAGTLYQIAGAASTRDGSDRAYVVQRAGRARRIGRARRRPNARFATIVEEPSIIDGHADYFGRLEVASEERLLHERAAAHTDDREDDPLAQAVVGDRPEDPAERLLARGHDGAEDQHGAQREAGETARNVSRHRVEPPAERSERRLPEAEETEVEDEAYIEGAEETGDERERLPAGAEDIVAQQGAAHDAHTNQEQEDRTEEDEAESVNDPSRATQSPPRRHFGRQHWRHALHDAGRTLL